LSSIVAATFIANLIFLYLLFKYKNHHQYIVTNFCVKFIEFIPNY